MYHEFLYVSLCHSASCSSSGTDQGRTSSCWSSIQLACFARACGSSFYTCPWHRIRDQDDRRTLSIFFYAISMTSSSLTFYYPSCYRSLRCLPVSFSAGDAFFHLKEATGAARSTSARYLSAPGFLDPKHIHPEYHRREELQC